MMFNKANLFYALCGYRSGNAGDLVTKQIIERLFGIEVNLYDVHTQKDKMADQDKDDLTDVQRYKEFNRNITGSGSIIQDIPVYYNGHIWGSGLINEYQRASFPYANILAVRGDLTRNRIEQTKNSSTDQLPAIGDTGLLINRLYPEHVRTNANPRKYIVGFIPHYVDNDNEELSWFLRKNDWAVSIDICDRLDNIVNRMSECDFILSSSLHGIVFADALGIPSGWMRLSDKLSGGSFKFRDYYSAFGNYDPLPCLFHRNMTLDNLRSYTSFKSEHRLEEIRQDLITVFEEGFLK